jgi:xanthine/CO dehydrogenase XdhC/CoxF family maturation factor
VGVLGPKKKLDRMLNELREEGLTIGKEELKGIYGPVGLAIGAETSEEIALSILSEIKAVLSRNDGKFLRDMDDAIHPRHNEVISRVEIK